jgi:hypothetical protein
MCLAEKLLIGIGMRGSPRVVQSRKDQDATQCEVVKLLPSARCTWCCSLLLLGW